MANRRRVINPVSGGNADVCQFFKSFVQPNNSDGLCILPFCRVVIAQSLNRLYNRFTNSNVVDVCNRWQSVYGRYPRLARTAVWGSGMFRSTLYIRTRNVSSPGHSRERRGPGIHRMRIGWIFVEGVVIHVTAKRVSG